jgi:hypothetical protein
VDDFYVMKYPYLPTVCVAQPPSLVYSRKAPAFTDKHYSIIKQELWEK